MGISELSVEVIKTMSSFRSRFKETAKGAVPMYYGFMDLSNSEEVKEIVQVALKDENFTFHEFDVDRVCGVLFLCISLLTFMIGYAIWGSSTSMYPPGDMSILFSKEANHFKTL
jgi:Domain of unknown function (DUF6532)